MKRIFFGTVLTAIACTLGTQQLEAQVQRQAQAVTSASHNINPGPFSPFFTQATGADGTVFDFADNNGLAGSIVAGAADTTIVSGTLTIIGNSSSGTNFNDGNGLPRGLTVMYDVSFSISTNDGLLVTAGGNTGNGIAPGALPSSEFDPGESIEFSAATISNVVFAGTPTDPGVTFTPGTVSVGLSQFRSANFFEAAEGAILDNGTDTIGFGVSTGTVVSGGIMNNSFTAAARFPAMMMDVPITLTNDAATGTFNIKGLELTTFLDYQFTSPTSDSNVALTDFSHNINPGPFSPFFTQATGDDGTVYDFTAERGLVGSIVAGAADTTTVSGTVDIVGTATAASNFSNGNQLPEGVTLSYDLNFTISSPDGLLTTSNGNTGNGIGVGPGQFEATNNGEQLVFSPATISNIAFSGTPTDGSTFVPGTVSDVALTNFRSANFPEATTGAVLSDGTDSVGFGIATGSVASNIPINNSFAANARFPGFSLLTNPVTLTADTGTSSFNLKGFELATIFTYTIGGALKGDVDMDGEVDFADIPPFIVVLQSGEFQAEADCNCNSEISFADIPPFIAILRNQ